MKYQQHYQLDLLVLAAIAPIRTAGIVKKIQPNPAAYDNNSAIRDVFAEKTL